MLAGVLALTLLTGGGLTQAAVKLPTLVADHMVVQRGLPVHIWGKADPGEAVSVNFRGETGTAVADDLGQFSVYLTPGAAGGPFEMRVKGTNEIVLKDILVGDVWVAAGQSNMEWPIQWAGAPETEMAAASHPRIRLSRAMHRVSEYAFDDLYGTPWAECRPEAVAGFSAVGYHFGRNLQEKLGVPIGLIQIAWGGTPIDSWTSYGALTADASLMPALAAVTARIQIAPLVACAGFRNPALIAKMADTIDEISGGRFILGLGAGWHEPEFDAFGFPFDHRVSRFEEALTIIHGLLRTGQIDFEGKWYTARECELRPRGPRPEGPPIVIGSSSPRMMRLMARYADAWNRDRINDIEMLLALEAKVDAACVEVGRDPATLDRIVGIQVDLLNDQREAFTPRQWVREPWPLTGSPEELADQIRAYTRAHVDHLVIWLDPVTPDAVEAFAPVLDLLDR